MGSIPVRIEAKIENLRDLRKVHGQTLTEAAAQMGISASRLSFIENGKGKIYMDQASQMARMYNTDLNTIYRLYQVTRKNRKK